MKMSKIYHKPGIPFFELIDMLKTPGIVKPEITNLGFEGVEIRTFFKRSLFNSANTAFRMEAKKRGGTCWF